MRLLTSTAVACASSSSSVSASSTSTFSALCTRCEICGLMKSSITTQPSVSTASMIVSSGCDRLTFRTLLVLIGVTCVIVFSIDRELYCSEMLLDCLGTWRLKVELESDRVLLLLRLLLLSLNDSVESPKASLRARRRSEAILISV